METVDMRQFKIEMLTVQIKPAVLRQLPERQVLWGQAESGAVELLCWIRGEALRRNGGRQPYVLCRDFGSGDVFLWRPMTPGYDGNTMLAAGKRVPFAIVP